jgi:glutathione S-transferase
MKLFYSPGACSLSPHIALREGGFDFELVKVDMRTRLLPDGTDFHTLSPNAYVPALQLDDGTMLTEGPAIVQYIADLAPGKGLMPATGTDRYRAIAWLNYVATELHKNFGPLVRPGIPDETKKAALEMLNRRFAVAEDALAQHDYLLESGYSVADGYLFVVCTWAARFGPDMNDFPALSAFVDRVRARPAVAAALEAEGLTA